MQQRAHDGARPPVSSAAPGRATLATAESEYIQILLTDKLVNADLGPQEVLCAVGWLGQWVESIAIGTARVAGNAYAIYPLGSEGLVSPPRVITAGLLWLDLAPLHGRIRQEINEENSRPAGEDDGNYLPVHRRIALLNRLLLLWRGPKGNELRKEQRRDVRKSVRVAFRLPEIALTMRLLESGFGEPRVPVEGVTVDEPVSTTSQKWTVNDVSDSGCRLHGIAAFAEGATGLLVAMRVDVTSVWIVGIVRRHVAVADGESDLGIQILSTSVRLLALEDVPAAGEPVNPLQSPAPATVAGSISKPALLLGPGAGPHARIRQSVLVMADDYAHGRVYYCRTKKSLYKLTLDKTLERHGSYVWAALRVVKEAALLR